MAIIFKKTARIIIGIISATIQVANLFIGNIIIYETTEGVKFDWMALVKNKLFWIVSIFIMIYYLIPVIARQHVNIVDERLEQAISDNSIELINFATESVKNGDFESSKKAIKMLDKIQKRRGR